MANHLAVFIRDQTRHQQIQLSAGKLNSAGDLDECDYLQLTLNASLSKNTL